jgi:hypothetical protein
MSHDLSASIKRSPHNKEHPYTTVTKALIRDETVSPNCRWLVAYLLSNIDKWEIKVAQVVEHVKKFIGRDAVYKIFDEAIEAGYLVRHQYVENGLKRTTIKINLLKR